MARQIITKTFTIAASGYAQPAKTIPASTVVELSAGELAAITGAGGTARVTTFRDTTGEQAGVSNSN